MEKIYIQLFAVYCVFMMTGNSFAATQTFTSTPPGLTLISELGNTTSTPNPALYPNPASYPFPVSITYPTGLWSNNVTSAILNVCLADDLSTDFPPNFDSPREFAIIDNIQDGSSSTPGTEVEVFPNPFIAGEDGVPPPPAGDVLVATATNAGIENPNLLPPASSQCYEVDVTAMLNSSNSGTLSFTLDISSHFPDITPTNNPDAFALITFFALQNGVTPENPYHVWEDYVYEKAQLTVTYGSKQPTQIPTLSEWAKVLLMLGLAGFATMRLRHS